MASAKAVSPHTDDSTRPYNRRAGEEPVPGYTLIEPLGRGGFGEVWKAVAPGGLHKAIKFVSADPDLTNNTGGHALRQEFEAFQTIKMIRHPFLLQLERVELIDTELIMVMELADEHLQDRYKTCTSGGLVGIPRSELLGYLADAAEALDIISTRHGLQHLDIKPANIFIICGRAKVGDYGLVARLGGSSGTNATQRGLTPRYVAPEVLKGLIDSRSDQYSLALVYFELLTGGFPYMAKNAQQMMMMHVSTPPDLRALPEHDRSAVARALSKKPEERFPSCLAFLHSLISAASAHHETMQPHDTMLEMMRRSRVDEAANSDLSLPIPTSDVLKAPPSRVPEQRPVSPAFGAPPVFGAPPAFGAPKTNFQPRSSPAGTQSLPVGAMTRPANNSDTKSVPPLTTIRQKPDGFLFPAPTPAPIGMKADEAVELILAASGLNQVQLPDVRSIVPVAVLEGKQGEHSPIWADQYVDLILSHVSNGKPPRTFAEPISRTDGSWKCHFPTTLRTPTARLKLVPLLEDDWFDEIEQLGEHLLVLRRFAAAGMWAKISGKRGGMEARVHIPNKMNVQEVEVQVQIFGTVDADFRQGVEDAVPGVMSEIRSALCNFTERRKYPRISCELPVRLYPLDNDLCVLEPIQGLCVDVSQGGVCIKIPRPASSRYLFATFDVPGPIQGLAILLRMMRELNPEDGVHILGARFRTDL